MKTTQTAKGDLLATIQIDIDKADYVLVLAFMLMGNALREALNVKK